MRSGVQPVTSRPPSVISPDVDGTSPESRLVSVDLPAPFGPITAWMRPRHKSTETPFTAASPPKRLVRFFACSTASLMPGLLAARQALHQAEQAARREQHHGNHEEPHPQLPVLAELELADRGQ